MWEGNAQEQQLIHQKSCCLYPLCQMWKERLLFEDSAAQKGICLCRMYWTFMSSLRLTTLQEENYHAHLKDWAWRGASKYSTLAMRKCLETIRRSWRARGGRCLSKPPPAVSKKFRAAALSGVLKNCKRTVYKRPNLDITDQMAAFHFKNGTRAGEQKLTGQALQIHKKALYQEFMNKTPLEKARCPVPTAL